MKLGTFEISGRKRLGAFEGNWAVDLSASYCAFLAAKGVPEPRARADAELPPEAVQFIFHNEISLPAARKAIDFVREKNFQVPGCVYPVSQITF